MPNPHLAYCDCSYCRQVPCRDFAQRRVPIERGRIEHDPLTRRVGIRHRDRRQQRARVGMRGRREEACRVAHLDDSSQIHHRDAAADVLDQPQIVRDEEVGELQLAAADPSAG